MPEQVAKMSVGFSETFNLNQDIKVESVEKPNLFNQFQDHVVWWNIRDERGWLNKVDQAFEIIKDQAAHNHPSDTAILLPSKKFGFECVGHFESKKRIRVNHVFEVGADEID